MKLSIQLNDLTPNEVREAIESGNENDLRDLILSRFEEIKEKNIQLVNFYYAYYVASSDKVFDMFSTGSIESLFGLFGYDVTWEETGLIDDYCVGELTVKKDGFAFKVNTVESMHDSLYAHFVDTKTAHIV